MPLWVGFVYMLRFHSSLVVDAMDQWLKCGACVTQLEHQTISKVSGRRISGLAYLTQTEKEVWCNLCFEQTYAYWTEMNMS